VQTFGGGNDVMIRLQPQGEHNNADGDRTVANIVVQAISTAENPAHLLRTEFVGPQVGKDLAMNGLYATIFMLIGFLVYIAFRFELKFAIVASITAFLDLIVTVGYVSATGREFDLTVLAGLLSVMGFAINDIIVVFDRVRENFRSLRAPPLEVLNKSINQTLSRTIITAVMFFLSAWALYLYGGNSMQGLALTHMIGAVVVVVSSIVVAVPMLSVRPFAVTKQDLMPKAKDEAALARRP
jgi:preprotein translocase subunit SecF